MGAAPTGVIGHRALPGTKWVLSALAFSLDPPAVGPPSHDDRIVTLLRRARARGVTTFDLAFARSPARGERLLARAFPEPDPEVSVILGRSTDSLASERSTTGPTLDEGTLPEALARSLDFSRQRLGSVPVSVVEWTSNVSEEGSLAPSPVASASGAGSESRYALALHLVPPVMELPVTARSPELFGCDFSLLRSDPIRWFGANVHGSNAVLLARDPFAGGRLDGSRFAASAEPGPPGVGPVDLRRLHEEFDPVLRLGFLTTGRRRTLAQAALHFVVGWPWVISVAAPMPAPERMEEVLDFASRPPLSAEELAELGFVK